MSTLSAPTVIRFQCADDVEGVPRLRHAGSSRDLASTRELSPRQSRGSHCDGLSGCASIAVVSCGVSVLDERESVKDLLELCRNLLYESERKR